MNMTFVSSIISGVILFSTTQSVYSEEPISSDLSSTELTNTQVTQSIASMSSVFTENQGQWNDSIQFATYNKAALIGFSDESVMHQFRRLHSSTDSRPGIICSSPKQDSSLTIMSTFLGANDNVEIEGVSKRGFNNNYFTGGNVDSPAVAANYNSIKYGNLYPKIDVRYYYGKYGLEYDLIIKSGGNISDIMILYEGIDSLRTDSVGTLLIHTQWGVITEVIPLVYQRGQGKQTKLDAEYVIIDSNTVGFSVISAYDPQYTVVIDPAITYSTFLGGNGNCEFCGANTDVAYDVAVDVEGSAYVVGYTVSGDFPVKAGFDMTGNCGGDIFVTKISSDGDSIIYSTFLGSVGSDIAYAIDVNSNGNAYIVGSSGTPPPPSGCPQTEYPLKNAYDRLRNGSEAILTMLGVSGDSLIFSTFFGGSSGDIATDLYVDDSGAIYLTGYTNSTDFPVVNAYDSTYNGGAADGFIAKFTPDGQSLVFSTYLGGASGIEKPEGIDVDALGFAYITGYTNSTDYPTVNALSSTHSGPIGGTDAFVSKVSNTGDQLLYSTYLGGSGEDTARAIAVNANGDMYIVGTTWSSDFPTLFALDNVNSVSDAFISKLNIGGMVWSTYLGPAENNSSYKDVIEDIVLDANDQPWVTGFTGTIDFPSTEPSFGDDNGCVFITQLSDTSGSLSIPFSKRIGTSTSWGERGMAIDMSPSGDMYVAGVTQKADFPVVNAFQPNMNDVEDAFVLKLDFGAPSPPSNVQMVDPGTGNSLIVTWDPSPSPNTTHYEVSGNDISPILFPSTIPYTCIVSGLAHTRSYTLAVRAYDNNKDKYSPGISSAESMQPHLPVVFISGVTRSTSDNRKPDDIIWASAKDQLVQSGFPEVWISDISRNGQWSDYYFSKSAMEFHLYVENKKTERIQHYENLYNVNVVYNKIDLVGHSSGGIVARRYIWAGDPNRSLLNVPIDAVIPVNNLLLIATPNGGVNTGWYPRLGASMFFIGYPLPSVSQMSVSSMESFNTYFPPETSPITGSYYTLAGTVCSQCATGLCSEQSSWAKGCPHDNVISTSQVVQGFENYPQVTSLASHYVLRNSGYIIGDIINPLSNPLNNNLYNPKSTLSLSNSSNAVDGAELVFSFTEEILPGQNLQVPFNSSSDSLVMIECNFGEAIVGISLLDPAMQVIDSTVIDPSISYSISDEGINYLIDNPVQGEWVLNVDVDILETSPVFCDIRVFVRSIIDLNPAQEHHNVIPGADVLIGCTLGQGGVPLVGAIISSYVSNNSDSLIDTLILFDDGLHNDGSSNDGFYANDYTTHSVARAYDILYKATGTDGFGLQFQRIASASVLTDPGVPAVPVILFPAINDSIIDVSPTFIWSHTISVGGAYMLELSIDSSFHLSDVISNITDSSYTILTGDELTSGEYYWRVKASSPYSHYSDFSNPIGSFTVIEGCCGQYTAARTGNADCTEDGKRNLADITRLIDRVYVSKLDLCCEANGNIDGDEDGKINLADITLLIDHVYVSKAETAACD